MSTISKRTRVRVPESNGIPEFYGEVVRIVSDELVHVKRYFDGLVFERPVSILEEVDS